MLAGFSVMMGVWIFYGGVVKADKFILAFEISFLAAVLFFALKALIKICAEIKREKSLAGLLHEKGYCDEYFNRLRKLADKASGDDNVYGRITLAGELSDGGRPLEAVEVMKNTDVSGASEELLAEYYNAYLYILLVNGYFDDAEIVYGAGMRYLEKFSLKRSNGGTILHTLGVLELARENYSKAENLFIRAKANASSQNVENSCNMYLALVYLRTDRKDYAKKTVSETIPMVENPRQRKEMKNLMRLIEAAYGF